MQRWCARVVPVRGGDAPAFQPSPLTVSPPFPSASAPGHWMFVTSVNGKNSPGYTPAPGDADPVLFVRDVIGVAPNTTMHAFYIVDNPSAWIVHCHIGKKAHGLRMGMAIKQHGQLMLVTLDLLVPLSLSHSFSFLFLPTQTGT